MRTLLILGSILAANSTLAEDLPEGLLFQASFDGTTTAKVAQGDAKLYSAKSLQGEDTQPGIVGDDVVLDADGGRAGGALRFLRKSSRYLFYRGNANLPYSKSDFSGTVSLWLRVTPDEDLPQGYVDPLQITDKKWNDASFFVDFTDKNPRTFRLGVFSDYQFWNPRDRKWDDIPDADRPLVSVTSPPLRETSGPM